MSTDFDPDARVLAYLQNEAREALAVSQAFADSLARAMECPDPQMRALDVWWYRDRLLLTASKAAVLLLAVLPTTKPAGDQ